MKNAAFTSSFNKALTFAPLAHQGQSMPGSELPYLVHLSRVAMTTIIAVHTDSNLDHNLAVQCAWLHDTIEDTEVTQQQLELEFDIKITHGVAPLTKNKSLSKTKAMEDSLARIVQQPKEIWMVKMAERIANLEPPPSHWEEQKTRSYVIEAELIVQTLGAANKHLADKLGKRISEYRMCYIP